MTSPGKIFRWAPLLQAHRPVLKGTVVAAARSSVSDFALAGVLPGVPRREGLQQQVFLRVLVGLVGQLSNPAA